MQPLHEKRKLFAEGGLRSNRCMRSTDSSRNSKTLSYSQDTPINVPVQQCAETWNSRILLKKHARSNPNPKIAYRRR